MDNIKLSVEETKFFINQKKRTVVCQTRFAFRRLNGIPCYISTIGKATCCKGDFFDVKKGKLLARTRGESTGYSMAQNILREEYNKMRDAYVNFAKKANGVHEHNREFIKSF